MCRCKCEPALRVDGAARSRTTALSSVTSPTVVAKGKASLSSGSLVGDTKVGTAARGHGATGFTSSSVLRRPARAKMIKRRMRKATQPAPTAAAMRNGVHLRRPLPVASSVSTLLRSSSVLSDATFRKTASSDVSASCTSRMCSSFRRSSKTRKKAGSLVAESSGDAVNRTRLSPLASSSVHPSAVTNSSMTDESLATIVTWYPDPYLAFRRSEVPSETTKPCFIMTILSPSRSASCIECVTSKIMRPFFFS
mmetsp:Transcript_1654/g.5305  ORF Transcript_1654/g.5305 Transcript_1654/m.5305 type:complete len:252 (+) Transcript_1654:1187-1942(+)